MEDIKQMMLKARQFVQERDWEQYQSPKNLSIALSLESSELLEIFQWMTDEESHNLIHDPIKMEKIKDEVSDILHCLLRFCDTFKIDLPSSFYQKIEKNALKYPIALSKGNKEKYTELKDA